MVEDQCCFTVLRGGSEKHSHAREQAGTACGSAWQCFSLTTSKTSKSSIGPHPLVERELSVMHWGRDLLPALKGLRSLAVVGLLVGPEGPGVLSRVRLGDVLHCSDTAMSVPTRDYWISDTAMLLSRPVGLIPKISQNYRPLLPRYSKTTKSH